MDDPRAVRGLHCIGDLADDVDDLIDFERCLSLRIALEKLAIGPLDRQKMEAGARLANLDRAHDIGMRDSCAVLCLAHETRNRGRVIAQLLPEELERDDAMP